MDKLIGEGVTSVSNKTNNDNMTHCDQVATPAHLFFMLQLVYSLVFLVGLVLNSFTMKVYFCSAQQQVSRIMMVYLKNLAVSDFLLCLYLPFRIISYTNSSITFHVIYCTFGASTFYLNMYVSILFMGYIAANSLLTPASLLSRYLKIIHPLGNHILQTVQAARIISTVTWVFLLAIVITYVTLSLLTQETLTIVPDTCDAFLSAQVNVFFKIIHTCSAAVFLFVFVSMVFFYYSASRSVLLAQQRQPASSSCKKLMKSRKKMLVLVSVFCICFVPYHLVRLPYTFLRRWCSLSLMLYYLKETTILLSALNICLDPLIYFIFCEAFRAQLSRPHSKKARRRSEGQPKASNSEASLSTSTRQTDGL
ncbi:P2Y purinoceptor 14-like [Thunnus albacares]|uniref:P2Y purinoceptor 14-like n=1 Tax=Thunnus albacares TaxID=8236 RepID=UPI001CF6DC97|nr:P2Y purinoceptor 14-like [Thunnus albacares]